MAAPGRRIAAGSACRQMSGPRPARPYRRRHLPPASTSIRTEGIFATSFTPRRCEILVFVTRRRSEDDRHNYRSKRSALQRDRGCRGRGCLRVEADGVTQSRSLVSPLRAVTQHPSRRRQPRRPAKFPQNREFIREFSKISGSTTRLVWPVGRLRAISSTILFIGSHKRPILVKGAAPNFMTSERTEIPSRTELVPPAIENTQRSMGAPPNWPQAETQNNDELAGWFRVEIEFF